MKGIMNLTKTMIIGSPKNARPIQHALQFITTLASTSNGLITLLKWTKRLMLLILLMFALVIVCKLVMTGFIFTRDAL
ncbi:hypothetical protein L596_011947 [Steinernema carpocapsae]|uniref:Uncharacterized protein n=1 Tax=Steinernema carpocapsae TaxID=34508 RepID=A0A4U5NWE6_STECR|nr:hypothetical protein L596_011947 [Steinernema carpocapsae]